MVRGKLDWTDLSASILLNFGPLSGTRYANPSGKTFLGGFVQPLPY